jgi:hypothetical protein
VNESLKRIAYDALTTRPNFAYTLKEVEADLKRVFATGVRMQQWTRGSEGGAGCV